MKEKIAKLIDVKSIVTLLLTVVFCVLCVMGTLPTEFLTIYTVIIGFYFGTQSQKKAAVERTGYTGPEQSLPVDGDTGPVHDAVVNDVHPPDGVMAKVGFEY